MSSGEFAGAAKRAPAVPIGNTYDKYGSTNPVVRRLMVGFDRALDELFSMAAPDSVLDVGCGEGVLTARWAAQLGSRRVVGVDLDDPKLHGEWDRRRRENLEFQTLGGGELQFAADSFDLVAATEVLEHVPDPSQTLGEMARVAKRHLLVSVPREPLWRMLNLGRGAYLRDLGNTPGHLNHWSRKAFVELLGNHGTVSEVRTPFPWTMALVAVGG